MPLSRYKTSSKSSKSQQSGRIQGELKQSGVNLEVLFQKTPQVYQSELGGDEGSKARHFPIDTCFDITKRSAHALDTNATLTHPSFPVIQVSF